MMYDWWRERVTSSDVRPSKYGKRPWFLASYTLETLPEPEDPKVTLRPVPARRMAAVSYSGFWSEKNYIRYKLELEAWIQEKGLTIVGDPLWARYNPPFTPWFLRRNEILIPVTAGTD